MGDYVRELRRQLPPGVLRQVPSVSVAVRDDVWVRPVLAALFDSLPAAAFAPPAWNPGAAGA